MELLLGAERGSDVSTCSFNPTIEGGPEDLGQDCGAAARWHVMVEGEYDGEPAYQAQLAACDRHLGRARGTGRVVSMHEFGSACGLPGGWWINRDAGQGSLCVTEETGLELGYLVWAEVS